MFCPKCGYELREDASFCARCGAQIARRPANQPVMPGGKPVSPPPPVTPGVPGPQDYNYKPKKRFPVHLVILGIVAVVLIVGIVFGVKSCAGGGGYSSPEEAADKLATVFDDIYAAEDTDDLTDAFSDLVDLMPSKAVDAMLDEGGYDDEEDLIAEELFGTYSIDEILEELLDELDGYEITVSFEPGDELDSDDVEDIQDFLDYYDINIEVESATELDGVSVITYGSESHSSSFSPSPIILVEIDGSWYVWVDM